MYFILTDIQMYTGYTRDHDSVALWKESLKSTLNHTAEPSPKGGFILKTQLHFTMQIAPNNIAQIYAKALPY